MTTFALGQRWLSESETELGLGIITQVQGRQVSVLFPAGEETRHYASHTAPLARYLLQVDDRGQHADGWHFTVTAVDFAGDLAVYQGLNDAEEKVMVPESQLAAQVPLNSPLTRLLAGQADRLDMYLLRREASEHLQRWQSSPVSGLLGGHIGLLAHQLYVAKTVADRFDPRVLLADEVGLGKTIEAGLIIHRRILQGRSQRVLLCIPDSLCHQWLVEMRRRFSLAFSLFDDERCAQAALDDENPFYTEQQVLIPQSLLQQPRWAQAASDAGWDLLVVDEAHHIAADSPAYQQLQTLSQASAGLLLLTATPEQLGEASHFARLQLLDPDRFRDFTEFQHQQQDAQALASLALQVSEQQPLSNDTLAQLQSKLPQLAVCAEPSAEQRQQWIAQLLDLYGTGRVMFRNTRAHIGGFPTRRLHSYPLAHDDLFDDAEVSAEPWWLDDPRVEWLLNHIKQHKPAKSLLICQSAEHVLDLAEALRVQAGIHAAVFHEGLSLLERDRAAAFFASEEEGSPILLSSEIGSEGRNFQFVQHLVLFDLPTNPDLLEQRIGRLDRIGQQGDVNIHVPYREFSVEQSLLRWYHEGMNAFEQCNPIGRAIADHFADDIAKLAADDASQLDDLITRTRHYQQQLKAELQQGRDILQQLSACQPKQAEAIVDAVKAVEATTPLAPFLMTFFDRFGVNCEALNDDIFLLRPSEHMRVPALPGLLEDGQSVTFKRDVALAREDVQLLSWDHPLVQSALELLNEDSYGSTCVAVLKNRALPAGAWFLELDFISQAVAPAAAVAGEFYPQQRLRVLLDSQGRDLTDKVPADALDKQAQHTDKKTARELLKQLRQACQALVNSGWQTAAQQQQPLIEHALSQVEQQLGQALQRLQQLAQRNPLVRDDEVQALQQRQQQLQQAIAQPQLSLHALRVLVNVPE